MERAVKSKSPVQVAVSAGSVIVSSAESPVHVAVVVEVGGTFLRSVCEGISRFARERGDWLLFPHKTTGNPTEIREWLRASRIDGIISAANSRELFLCLRATGIPLVNALSRDCGPGVSSVTTDSLAIGRLAAEFFLPAGFLNFAYCGYPGLTFSDLREQGFRDVLAAHGHSLYTISGAEPVAGYEQIDGTQSDVIIGEWLRRLPKPMALLAGNDVRGQQVIRLARDLAIDVPGELAVLGVDNDELLCNLSTPSLSSVDAAGEVVGHAAARLLDGLLRGSVKSGTELPIPPVRIVERQSTGIPLPENPLVARAFRLIRDSAGHNLTVKELCNDLRLSRTHLDNLFRQHLGRTPADEIKRVRLKHMTSLLQNTRLALHEVASRCGFSSATSFCQFVRRETGLSPRELRRRGMPPAVSTPKS